MDEIGQKLRDARIEKGYTIDDLQQITKIQKRYLIAIEEGDFDKLPGDFYVRAFIKQYADTVGLDSKDLLDQFQDDIPDTQPHEYVEKSVENQTRATRETTHSFSARLRGYLPQIIIVVIVVLIIGVIYAVAFAGRDKNNSTTDSVSTSVTVSSESSSSASSKESSKESESSESKKASSESKAADKITAELASTSGNTQVFTLSKVPSDKANTLTLSADDAAAWMMVSVNGSALYQGNIAAGAKQQVTLPAGTTSFTLQTGNAPATAVQLNTTKINISPNNESTTVRTITFNMNN